VALESLDKDCELQTAKQILEKYMRGKTADVSTLSKAFRYLMSKGFEYDIAKSALSLYGECEDE
jgi:SOS response regulatory protein OraA/RecX